MTTSEVRACKATDALWPGSRLLSLVDPAATSLHPAAEASHTLLQQAVQWGCSLCFHQSHSSGYSCQENTTASFQRCVIGSAWHGTFLSKHWREGLGSDLEKSERRGTQRREAEKDEWSEGGGRKGKSNKRGRKRGQKKMKKNRRWLIRLVGLPSAPLSGKISFPCRV